MIYQFTYEQVLNDRKHQSRRVAVYGERARCILRGDHVPTVGHSATWNMIVEPDLRFQNPVDQTTITKIYTPTFRAKWIKGHQYSVQPGRGLAGLGYVKMLGFRAERLQDISSEDAWDELGRDMSYWTDRIMDSPLCDQFLDEPEGIAFEFSTLVYKYVWNMIHTRKGERWGDNPPVWVLDFDLVSKL